MLTFPLPSSLLTHLLCSLHPPPRTRKGSGEVEAIHTLANISQSEYLPSCSISKTRSSQGDGSSNSTSRDRKSLIVPPPSLQGSLCSTGSEQLIPLPLGALFQFTIHLGSRGPAFRLTGTCPWTDASLPAPPSLPRDTRQVRETRDRVLSKTK